MVASGKRRPHRRAKEPMTSPTRAHHSVSAGTPVEVIVAVEL
jgi:hypothetical protein